MAEVLITLTIIGVIAAITIPNLMQKWSDHADIQKAKQAYSIVSNAVKMAVAENGQLSDWGWPKPAAAYDVENSEFFGKILSKYLKVEKYCGNTSGCFGYGYDSNMHHYTENIINSADLRFINLNGNRYAGPDNTTTAYGGKMILKNGMRIAIGGIHSISDINLVSSIVVDINGAKKPNRLGYDVFYFGLSNSGITPYPGYYYKNIAKDNCKRSGAEYQDDSRTCFYWIMLKDNMDYKYRDVSEEW